MNERIKELAEQAAISCGYFIGPRLYMTHEKEMEKFAELIVRECIDTAFHKGHPDLEFLLKHFGIEE